MDNKTITITLCDMAENHVGMQKIGKLVDEGFTLNDLLEIKKYFERKNATKIELIDLNYPIEKLDIYPDDEAYILVVRNGIDLLFKSIQPNKTSTDLFNELRNLKWDTKALMYGRVVNKHARHNLCFGNQTQKPNYILGKSTVVAFDKVPLLNSIKNKISKILGDKGTNLVAEGNYYYDTTKCGIGFHGDGERKKVVGLRLGNSMPLEYQWFYMNKPVGERIKLNFEHGDIYFMSEKATGNDWKKKSIHTLRHAAGYKFI
ncbi:MAG: hypothetical protein Satyrvirus6_17 [Satyrvirus sp.]|uniref:2OG-Fe(II) oxygenase n=1 Tax=Satyrvirus sp. TaxID=2487771 RepID=A0A3G5AD86_9VIRU|nr:MAG: hypothetical protein Satyrvirus6_17 [Satyrvirus sp.]